MNKIMVDIDPEEGFIKVWNNGNGIPVVMHEVEKCYVPELIFGNLLTGSNFDDNEQKTTGGRNGYGAKLANIFSTKFIVETFDSSRSQLYKQEFTDNMSVKGEPEIKKKSTGTDFTITFCLISRDSKWMVLMRTRWPCSPSACLMSPAPILRRAPSSTSS